MKRFDRRDHPIAWRLVAGLNAANRAAYRSALGPWLCRRLEDAREESEPAVELRRGSPELSGLRIAFVSDLHLGSFAGEREASRLFERVSAREPDLVCLGGDLVEQRPEDFRLLAKALPLLRAPLGVYAVPGNHEYHADPTLALYRTTLREHGVELLVNEGRRVPRGDASLWLAGVDDLLFGEPDLPAALDGVEADEPVVLLAHHPDFFVEAARSGVDLTLSGHTHGGQITWRGRTPLRHTRFGYWRGRHRRGDAQLYVGRGVGTTGLPFRIGEAPEVPILRLVAG